MKTVGYILLCILALIAAYFLICIFSALLVNTKKNYTKDSAFYRFLLDSATAVGMRLARVHIHVSGIEKVPDNSRFLVVGNHISKFDPIITWLVLKGRQLAFISKPENFNVPIFGRIIRKCGFMPIDRENARSAIETVNSAAEKLRSDEFSVGVYPEGTRSMSGELLPFHDGIFMIAKKANVPTVVLAVRGTEKIKDNYPLRRSDVYLDFVDVIDADTSKGMRTSQISARVYDDLCAALGK